jgi:hypothetical protein
MQPNNCPKKTSLHAAAHCKIITHNYFMLYKSESQKLNAYLSLVYLTTRAEYQTNMTCNKKRGVKIIN